jgi:hypothetical protein
MQVVVVRETTNKASGGSCGDEVARYNNTDQQKMTIGTKTKTKNMCKDHRNILYI